MSRRTIEVLPKIADRPTIEVGQRIERLRTNADRPTIEVGRRIERLRTNAVRPTIGVGRTIEVLRKIAVHPMIGVGRTIEVLRKIAARPMIGVGRTIEVLRTIVAHPRIAVAQTNSFRHFFFATLFSAHAAFGQSPDASAAFDEGRAAFQRQDYESALIAFDKALEAGMTGPAVHFNAGVAAYRSQRYDRAKQAFAEAMRTPSMAALAQYNLGLVALAQSDRAAAREHFRKTRDESEDERLQALARTQLDELAALAPRVTYGAFTAAGAGYDDNVTLSADGSALSVTKDADVYTDLLFAGTAYLASWRFDGDVSYLNYVELDDYDQWGVNAGGRYRLNLGDWRTDFGGQFGLTFLDGKPFERRSALIVQTGRSLSDTWYLRLRYRLAFVDADDEFSALDGRRHDLLARATFTGVGWEATLGYRVDVLDYRSEFYSALRHYAYVDAARSLTSRWRLRGLIGLRSTEYDDADVGSEIRWDALVGTEYRVSRRWTVVMQYLAADNDADVAEYDYRRNRYFIGAEATF